MGLAGWLDGGHRGYPDHHEYVSAQLMLASAHVMLEDGVEEANKIVDKVRHGQGGRADWLVADWWGAMSAGAGGAREEPHHGGQAEERPEGRSFEVGPRALRQGHPRGGLTVSRSQAGVAE